MITQTMNIYAKNGDKVVFHGENGYEFERERARTLLEIGGVYTVEHTEVFSSSTSVYLKELPQGPFNSVLFSDYKGGSRSSGVLHTLEKKQERATLPFIFSVDGRKLGPGHEPPTVSEIARGLGKNCRFAGQCRIFWPVLLHSMVVADLVSEDIQLYALLHDAAEAIFSDTPTPFKPAFFNAREHAVLRDLFESLGVPQPTDEVWQRVKVADMSALSAEAEIVGPRGLAAHLNAGYDGAAEDRIRYYLARYHFNDYLVDGGLAILEFEMRVRRLAAHLRKAA